MIETLLPEDDESGRGGEVELSGTPILDDGRRVSREKKLKSLKP